MSFRQDPDYTVLFEKRSAINSALMISYLLVDVLAPIGLYFGAVWYYGEVLDGMGLRQGVILSVGSIVALLLPAMFGYYVMRSFPRDSNKGLRIVLGAGASLLALVAIHGDAIIGALLFGVTETAVLAIAAGIAMVDTYRVADSWKLTDIQRSALVSSKIIAVAFAVLLCGVGLVVEVFGYTVFVQTSDAILTYSTLPVWVVIQVLPLKHRYQFLIAGFKEYMESTSASPSS